MAVVCARALRRRRARNRHKHSAQVRRTLLALVAGDDSGSARVVLASLDPPERAAIEPTAIAMLATVKGDSRAALIGLLDEWGAVSRALSGLHSCRAAHRASSAELIGYTGRTGLASALYPLVQDRDPHVRRAAVRALGRSGSGSSARIIIEALHHDRSIPVGIAANALLMLGPAAVADITAVGLTSPRAVVRATAATLLGKLGGPRDVEHLLPLLAHDEAAVAAASAAALGELGIATALGPLVSATSEMQPHELRVAAARALGRIGTAEAMTALHRLVSDPDHDVAHGSAHALAHLGAPGRVILLAIQADGGRSAKYATEAISR